MSKTIVFIHGNFVTNRCWDGWVARFQAQGHTCIAPPYPLRDRSVAELRRIPNDPALGNLGLPEVTDHYVRKIRALPEKPIIIGHSFGGLLTQLMMDRDLGAAAVAIDSVPPQGVLPVEWSFIRSTWPIVNPVIPASRPWLMTFDQFRYAFGNDLSLDEARRAYDAEVVPESRRLSRGGLTSAARVDFRRRRGPLLLIGGEKDHIMPASLNRRNWKAYQKAPSVTEFKQFPGRGHYSILAGKGWEQVADYALSWALRMAGTGVDTSTRNGEAAAGKVGLTSLDAMARSDGPSVPYPQRSIL